MAKTPKTPKTPKTQVAGRLVVLGVLGVLGAAAMSMHQQLFLLCARKASPAPPLPYDYEVEYIERNCSIPWVDGNGTEIDGYFDLGRYADASETLGTMRPLEATWSFEPLSAGPVYALSRQTGLVYRGCLKSNNHDDYVFAPSTGLQSGISGDLDVMRTQRMEYSGGNVKGFIDGTLVVDVATAGTAKFSNARLMYANKTTATTHYSGRMRVAAAKIGNDVDLIPVVKGSAVGFYNKGDGELFLAEQACLSAGPRK